MEKTYKSFTEVAYAYFYEYSDGHVIIDAPNEVYSSLLRAPSERDVITEEIAINYLREKNFNDACIEYVKAVFK